MTKPAKQRLTLIALLLLAVCWWWEGWNFNDPFVAGEYVAKATGECNVLVLNHDHTFDQKLLRGGRAANTAVGKWYRFGEAGVAFSNSFIGAAPKTIAENNVYGMLDNTFGFHTLTLDPQTAPTTFHKRFLHLRTCAW
jgi:hypothetical protein